MTNRAHSEANLPRPVALVPVAKPRGKMTSPPSQTTPHHYANQNENRNQNTTNHQIANHHSGLFHYETFFSVSKLRLGSDTFRRFFEEITCCGKEKIETSWLEKTLDHFYISDLLTKNNFSIRSDRFDKKNQHQIINKQRD